MRAFLASMGILMGLLSIQGFGACSKHKAQKQVKVIHAEELKSWYNQNRAMYVIDARSEGYFDGTLLPNAKWLPAESSDETIRAILPEKNAVIVVYCYGIDCPASGWLVKKLVSMGYTNLYEYPEGIQDWIKHGYPTTKP